MRNVSVWVVKFFLGSLWVQVCSYCRHALLVLGNPRWMLDASGGRDWVKEAH